MSTFAKVICFVVSLSATTLSQAKTQALLIGIGQYPEHQKLAGPVNDVALIESILLQNEYLPHERINVLLDEEATRKNILSALHSLLKTTEPEDKIVLYFSGHGTSALNDQIDANLPPHTGALVPYDIDDITNQRELNQRLLIGRRDLRPVLTKLDMIGAQVLVLIDACFSGNVVRGDNDARTLPDKFLDFSELLQFQKSERSNQSLGLLETVQYPYKNVFLIAAAQEDQTTVDIPEEKVSQFGTIDSKSHGAFTDSLVQSLVELYESTNEIKASLTLADLHLATRRFMKKKGFLSTPSLLPDNPARTDTATLYSFFGQTVSFDSPVMD